MLKNLADPAFPALCPLELNALQGLASDLAQQVPAPSQVVSPVGRLLVLSQLV